MIPFSVLDLAPNKQGSDAAQAFRNSVSLARHAERLGYRRYWLAEHHNIAGIASAATARASGLRSCAASPTITPPRWRWTISPVAAPSSRSASGWRRRGPLPLAETDRRANRYFTFPVDKSMIMRVVR